ncbi:hypothetical protein SNC59_11365, partial [Escherichia coli]
GTADRNRSHWSTSKTPSYTKSVSWQHHLEAKTFAEMLGITEGELIFAIKKTGTFKNKTIPQPHEPHKSNNRFLYSDVMRFIESLKDK